MEKDRTYLQTAIEQGKLDYDEENPDIDKLMLLSLGGGVPEYSYEGRKNKFKVSWHNICNISEGGGALDELKEIRIFFVTPKGTLKEERTFAPDQLQEAVSCFYEYKKQVIEYDELT